MPFPALDDIKTAAHSRPGYALTQTLCVQLPAWLKKLQPAWPQVARMRHRAFAAMPADEKTDPIKVSFFSTQDMVRVANPLSDLI